MTTATVHLADADLRHLAALRAVAEEGGFGRAATHLGFTQSAVSQQIATLERLVGEPLFDRPGGPRPVTLTAAGRMLLPHAVSVLERVRAAEADLMGLRSGQTGTLRVGTFQSISVRILPEVLAALHRERPGVHVLPFESDDQGELLGLLRPASSTCRSSSSRSTATGSPCGACAPIRSWRCFRSTRPS